MYEAAADVRATGSRYHAAKTADACDERRSRPVWQSPPLCQVLCRALTIGPLFPYRGKDSAAKRPLSPGWSRVHSAHTMLCTSQLLGEQKVFIRLVIFSSKKVTNECSSERCFDKIVEDKKIMVR